MAARASLLLVIGVGACAQIIGAEDPIVQGGDASTGSGSAGGAQTGGGMTGTVTTGGGQAAGGNGGAGGTAAGPGGGMGGATTTSSGNPTCNNNGVPDEMETGTDCGGPVCPPCGIQQGCDTNADCQMAPLTLCCKLGLCCENLNGCMPSEICPDGCRNGDETDIDCGGMMCATRCMQGQRCMIDADCLQGCFCQVNMMAKECQCT
jgi:hypothetical protein